MAGIVEKVKTVYIRKKEAIWSAVGKLAKLVK